MLTPGQLQTLRKEKIEINNLKDIKEIKINTQLPIIERMKDYISQISNPYYFLSGKTPVRVRFSNNGKTIDEAILNYFLKEKNK